MNASMTEPNTTHQLQTLQWNINGLPQNWHELKQALSESSSSIFCLQETKLKPSDPYNFNLYSYSFYRKDSLQILVIDVAASAPILKTISPTAKFLTTPLLTS